MSNASSIPSSPHISTPATSLSPSPSLSKLTLQPEDVSEAAKAEAAKLKAQANKAFTNHHFNDAADLYTKAIELNPTDATFWCNRAYTRIKLEEHGYGLSDASMYGLRSYQRLIILVIGLQIWR
ncbi:hypothetical protein BKA93DRAFT_12704 [Sparassis latifolia]